MVHRIFRPISFRRMLHVEWILDLFILGSLLLLAMVVPLSVAGLENIGRDSGVFLYAGQRILAGDVPYRDVWDHKGPVIYYINALGLWIGNGSRSGVLLLEYLSLLIAIWFGYSLIQRAFGRLPAAFANLLFLLSLILLFDPGNWVEEFALPLQVIALYSFWRMESGRGKKRFPFAIGATAAVVLLLRPNLIGIQLSISLYLLLSAYTREDWHHRLIQMAYMVAGAFTVLLPTAIYLGYQGALDDFWGAAVRYNLLYSSGPLWRKFAVSFQGLQHLSQSGIPFVALTAWGVAGYQLWRTGGRGAQAPLYGVAMLALPLEFALVSVSGNTYRHYYLIWLPVLTLLSAIFASQFLNNFAPAIIKFRFGKVRAASLWLMAMIGSMSILPARATALHLWPALREEYVVSDVVAYVQEHTPQGSYLLMWGAEAEYNFLSGRPAPTRFVYQYPLFMSGYTNAAMFAELLDDIEAKKPLIIDASLRTRSVPPLAPERRETWGNGASPAGAAALFRYIDEHYEQIAALGEQQWPVFAYRGK